MQDREIMENQLLLVKGACDLYMHGALESTTAEVHTAFKDALNETLNLQNKIYNLMVEHGWYTVEMAEQEKIDNTKNKFESGS